MQPDRHRKSAAAKAPALFVLRATAPRATAARIAAVLELLGGQPVVWQDAHRRTARIEQYFAQRRDALAHLRRLAPFADLSAPDGPVALDVVRLPAEDWRDAWRRFFGVTRVSDRIVIKPTWRRARPRPGDVTIELDPGMSFGTGAHPTTRACLRLLDDLARQHPRATFLDVGCGSGILAIAAARLGLRRVTALDNDPQAVVIAAENAGRNGVAERIACRRESVFALDAANRPYDIAAANLLAGLLRRAAPRLCAAVRPGGRGRLILSGIRSRQYPAVAASFAEFGFTEEARVEEEGWTTGCWRSGLRKTRPVGGEVT